MRNLYWQADAWQEYVDLQSDKAMIKKINNLLKDIMRNGYGISTGGFEMLKGELSGYASVRIDKKTESYFRVTKIV